MFACRAPCSTTGPFFVFMSMAKKLGASGAGMALWLMSKPFEVITNIRVGRDDQSGQQVGQVVRLQRRAASCIMSSGGVGRPDDLAVLGGLAA